MLKKAIILAMLVPTVSIGSPFKFLLDTLTILAENHDGLCKSYDNPDPAQPTKELAHITAIWQGNADVANRILQRHPELVNTKDKYGNTALIAATSHKKNHILQKLLTYQNIEVNSSDKQGLTPLHWACIVGNHEGAQTLLEHDADPNIQDLSEQTPLHYSCSIRDEPLIQLLLKHNANPTILNKSHTSPLDTAINQEISLITLIQLLSLETFNHETAEKAALAGHLDLFEYLWRQGIRPNNKFNLPAPVPTTCIPKKARWNRIKQLINAKMIK